MSSDPRLAGDVSSRSVTPNPPPPPPPPPPEDHWLNSSQAPGSQTKTVLWKPITASPLPHLHTQSYHSARDPWSAFLGRQLPSRTYTIFNTVSYSQIYDELQTKDPRLYRNNGVLPMLDRNRSVKWGPERFQEWTPGLPRLDHVSRGDKGSLGTEGGIVDVIITCEEKCWDAVVDDLMNRGAPLNRPVHVFNVDIRDNHEEALVGSKAILDLADRLNEAADQERKMNGVDGWDQGGGAARRGFDEKVPEILAKWQEKWPNLPALWTLSWF
ncbi:hypothetical protein UREG_01699 [Uncinocarpus reesii 1704]|uniref:RNA polymerase II subunit A C-terminal domain phosphatase SSU72 n=1 Tax=Uncinocarpus reesii (strain UAMH 1704) TaxID=336963 RepID=C4JJ92_UNCRE|nr:uncharacterized protein UREG_01699 [Uncinocarpus reesii 1704]EEP76850.1 hypothetical protein UREG_01699 [Uncinocarpus reesii 1704]